MNRKGARNQIIFILFSWVIWSRLTAPRRNLTTTTTFSARLKITLGLCPCHTVIFTLHRSWGSGSRVGVGLQRDDYPWRNIDRTRKPHEYDALFRSGDHHQSYSSFALGFCVSPFPRSVRSDHSATRRPVYVVFFLLLFRCGLRADSCTCAL